MSQFDDEISDLLKARKEHKIAAQTATARLQDERVEFLKSYKAKMQDLVKPSFYRVRDNPENDGAIQVEAQGDAIRMILGRATLEVRPNMVGNRVEIQEANPFARNQRDNEPYSISVGDLTEEFTLRLIGGFIRRASSN